jgi:lysophospholipase L1-like esterase
MKRKRFSLILVALVCCVGLLTCVKVPRENKIEFVYLALGASDATGVGALPLTEGYVYLIKDELDRHLPGVALLNLGVPGARINLIKEQVRLAVQVGTKADLATIWTGANDLIHGDGVAKFQEDLRFVLQNLREHVSKVIVVANLPDLTQLPRFRSNPDPAVNLERVRAFNRAIEEETRVAGASVVNLFVQPVRDDLVFDLDGFHPNDTGHREIARLFLEVVLPALGVKR